MTHISFCGLSHHLSVQFYTYFLVRQAVIRVLINLPSGSLVSSISVSNTVLHVPRPYLGDVFAGVNGAGLEVKCFPHAAIYQIYCSVAG